MLLAPSAASSCVTAAGNDQTVNLELAPPPHSINFSAYSSCLNSLFLIWLGFFVVFFLLHRLIISHFFSIPLRWKMSNFTAWEKSWGFMPEIVLERAFLWPKSYWQIQTLHPLSALPSFLPTVKSGRKRPHYEVQVNFYSVKGKRGGCEISLILTFVCCFVSLLLPAIFLSSLPMKLSLKLVSMTV